MGCQRDSASALASVTSHSSDCGCRNHLNSVLGSESQGPPTRAIFFCDVAVQTDSMALGVGSIRGYGSSSVGITERKQSKLSADDLWAILKSSQDISSDINLSSGDPYVLR